MASFLVDSSVLLDLFTQDLRWFDWSATILEEAFRQGNVVINPVIYSEISVRFSRVEDLELTLRQAGLPLVEIPREALFLAGKAFVAYRRSGGAKSSPLPDFFIGAHAAVSRLILITRDPARIASYFPSVELQTPDRD
ncbi:MAG: type II toxin-antitoxin system VapC family toxin [Spirochaetota bacterium]